MKHGVVIAHGQLGQGVIDAASTIMGNIEGLSALSVTEMSVSEIHQRLNALVANPAEGVDGIVLMACLRGGSSWNVSSAVANDHKHVRVISGVNLAMLLSFITNRDRLDLDDLMQAMVVDSTKGIHLLA